jgi:hypothetical protein
LYIKNIKKKYIKIFIQITIPTELIGSLPRTTVLLEGQLAYKAGHISQSQLEKLQDQAVRQSLSELEKTGPGQLTDGEQAKPSFLIYPYVFEYFFFFISIKLFLIKYAELVRYSPWNLKIFLMRNIFSCTFYDHI